MGWRLRKTWKLGPVRVTASKKGLGASVGVAGVRAGVGPDGRRRFSVSGHGSGVSYQTQWGDHGRQPPPAYGSPAPYGQPRRPGGDNMVLIVLLGLGVAVAVLAIIGAVVSNTGKSATSPPTAPPREPPAAPAAPDAGHGAASPARAVVKAPAPKPVPAPPPAPAFVAPHCCDGTPANCTGRGCCSHHGGVC